MKYHVYTNNHIHFIETNDRIDFEALAAAQWLHVRDERGHIVHINVDSIDYIVEMSE